MHQHQQVLQLPLHLPVAAVVDSILVAEAKLLLLLQQEVQAVETPVEVMSAAIKGVTLICSPNPLRIEMTHLTMLIFQERKDLKKFFK